MEVVELRRGLLPADIETIDLGHAGPLPQASEELFHIRGRSFGQDLDPAVREVSDPAGQAKPVGVLLGEKTKGDALDEAVDEDMDPDEFPTHGL